ncbi:MAG: ABC transporter ATP-binding protein, partial [Candidatus Thermoplasmatota archaeon]|nr:ABC transporter ATP-binding protein [Candidatus Thermoplasmatota archaeon]
GAMNAFNPVYRVGDQVKEALLAHMDLTREETDERVAELFDLVGLDREMMRSYPHEFSGGMKQRAMIAMSVACNPDLIIADEPTTALDVIMQDKILAEVRDLQREFGIAMMIITHDISVVAEVADRIAIMYAGEIAEEGSIGSVFAKPSHPYTIGLMEAFPSIKGQKRRLKAIPGSPPDLVRPPSGCRFHPRCRYAKEICESESPRLVEVEPGHRAACHFAQEIYSGELA